MRYTPDPHRFQLFSSQSDLGGSRRHERRFQLALLAVAIFGVEQHIFESAVQAATPPPLRVPHAAVASDHAEASAAGVALLRRGGNAADAACATALALGVVNPHASGIGGGGFALVYVAREKKTYALDFREQAPAAITPQHYHKDGKPDPSRSQRGGLAVGVPGEVRGLAELVKRFGRRSFAACVAPAERLAGGFRASSRLVEVLAARDPMDAVSPDPVQRAAFLRNIFANAGPIRTGDLVSRPALRATLTTLRRQGPDSFYRGPLARQIVAAVKEAGGVVSAEDLARYAVIERTPIAIDYRGHRVQAMPSPSSGGVVIAEALGILAAKAVDDGHAAPARGSSAQLHRLAETLKHGFADRALLLGDADFVKVPLDRLLDPGYHKSLAGRIDDKTTLSPTSYGSGAGQPPPHDGGTAHLSVIDAEGNAVALTTTVNTWFGAHLVAGKTGIVLNNQMDDFAIAPNTPNSFGLVGNAQNAVAAGKRPLSSMSPTIVLAGDTVKMVVGGAGGPTIISGTLQVLLNVLDGGLNAQAASAAPRIHHQWEPNVLGHEPDIAPDVLEGLGRRGHKTAVRPSLAFVNVIVRTANGLEAATEFRSGGAPAGY